MKFKPAFFIGAALVAMLPFTSFTGKDAAFVDASFVSGDTSDTRRVIINDQYSMAIPKHMKVSKELNDEASLQYQDLEEELYVIVIDEPKDEFVAAYKKIKDWDNEMTVGENYRRVQVAAMKKKIKVQGKPVVQKTTIGELDAEIVDFTGKVKGIQYPIAYKLGFLAAGKNVYMIMAWTLAERKGLHNQAMNDMIKSFRIED